eukprot:PhM_4_TR15668/c1_g1_i2/m.21096
MLSPQPASFSRNAFGGTSGSKSMSNMNNKNSSSNNNNNFDNNNNNTTTGNATNVFVHDFSGHLAHILQLVCEQQEMIHITDTVPFVNNASCGLFTYNNNTHRVDYTPDWPQSTTKAKQGRSTTFSSQHNNMNNNNNNNNVLSPSSSSPAPTASRQSDQDRQMQVLFDHFGRILTEDERELDIVAVYVARTELGVSVDYLNRERLYSFLCSATKPDGILQRYVIPQKYRHTVLQIVWTPELSLVEGRQNVHDVFNSTLSVGDRTSTSAPQSAKSVEIPIQRSTRARLIELCRRLTKLVNARGRETTRMCVYFTMSSENSLVLMWCSILEWMIKEKQTVITNLVRPLTTSGKPPAAGGATSSSLIAPRAATASKRLAPFGSSLSQQARQGGDGGGPSGRDFVNAASKLNPHEFHHSRRLPGADAVAHVPDTPLNSPNHRATQIFSVEDPIWFEHGVWIDNLHPSKTAVEPPPPGTTTRHIVFLNFDSVEPPPIRSTVTRVTHDAECEATVEQLQQQFRDFQEVKRQRSLASKLRHLQENRTRHIEELFRRDQASAKAKRSIHQSVSSRPHSRGVFGAMPRTLSAGPSRSLGGSTTTRTVSSSASGVLNDTTLLDDLEPEVLQSASVAEVRARYGQHLPEEEQEALFQDFQLEQRMNQIRGRYVQQMLDDSLRDRRAARGQRRPCHISISERLKKISQEEGWNPSVLSNQTMMHEPKKNPVADHIRAIKRPATTTPEASRLRSQQQREHLSPGGISASPTGRRAFNAPDGSLLNYMCPSDADPGGNTNTTLNNTNATTAPYDNDNDNGRNGTGLDVLSPRSILRRRREKAGHGETKLLIPSRRFTVPPPPIMDVDNTHGSISQELLMKAIRKGRQRPRLYDVLCDSDDTDDEDGGSRSSARTRTTVTNSARQEHTTTTTAPFSLHRHDRSPQSERLNQTRTPGAASLFARSGMLGSSMNNNTFNLGGSTTMDMKSSMAMQRGEYSAVESRMNARKMVDAAEDMIYRAYSESLDHPSGSIGGGSHGSPVRYEFPYPSHVDAPPNEVRSMMLALGFEEKIHGEDVNFVLSANHVHLSNALSTIQNFSRFVDVLFDGKHAQHVAAMRRLVENGMSFFDAVSDVKKALPLSPKS